jgi:hypothetical protein
MLPWYDIGGTLGVILILAAYFLLQTERLGAASLLYSGANLIGATLIAISLLFDFNLSAFIIEVCWMAISLYGIARYWRSRNGRADSSSI